MATVKNIITNELLCFISNKIKKMTYDMLLKLVMDFYDDDAVFLAKSVLLDNVVLPEDDDKKRSRKGLNKKLNTMKDILNVFLIMTLEEIPLFVASDLANLPPLSMDNFDMSSVVREMEVIKNQMKIMQEVQEASLTVHAALCGDKSRAHLVEDVQTNVERSPAPSTGATPPRQTPHTPVMSPPTLSPTAEISPSPIQQRRIDDNGGTDEDILRLAQIQGRLSFSPRYRTRNRSADRRHFNTSFNLDHSGHRIGERAVHVNRERGRQDMHMDHNRRDEDRRGLYRINNDRHRDEEHREHTTDGHRERPSNRYNRNDHRDRSNKRTSNQRTHGNNITDRSTRTTVITGTSNCQTLTAATPRHTQQKDGLFISRLSRHTRATDVVSYIRNEANLNLRCDPVPTKYDSYRSYYIHAHPRHHGLLLRPGMWPKNVIVRPYL